MSQSTHINARCKPEKKEEYIALARAFGYSNFSEFLIAVLDSMNERYGNEGWESHLVYVSGDQIVAVDTSEGFSLATAAFPLVAPKTFWNHLIETLEEINDESA